MNDRKLRGKSVCPLISLHISLNYLLSIIGIFHFDRFISLPFVLIEFLNNMYKQFLKKYSIIQIPFFSLP